MHGKTQGVCLTLHVGAGMNTKINRLSVTQVYKTMLAAQPRRPVPVKYAGSLATVTFSRWCRPCRCGRRVLATSCRLAPSSAGMLVMTCGQLDGYISGLMAGFIKQRVIRPSFDQHATLFQP